MDAIKVSVIRTSQPVELEDEDGRTIHYQLREMTGAIRDQYLNAQRKVFEPTKHGNVIKDFTGSQSSLICRCLYEAEGGKPVPEAKIQEWPVGVQDALFEAAQKINHLERVGSANAMQRIYVVMAQPDMDDAEKLAAIQQVVDAWRKGDLDEQGES